MKNREIEFRAWDMVNETMVYDPYLFESWSEYRGNAELNPPFVFTENWQDADDGIWLPCDIMQYTEHKDANGLKIYDKDIITVGKNELPYLIVFKDGSWQIKIFPWHKKALEYLLLNISCNEVMNNFIKIGNIYENPDILK